MLLYQKGEYRAFEELYDRHAGRVYGYFIKRGLSKATEADDLVQQTFLKLHQHRDRYNSSFPFLPWLFSIVRNLHIDFKRKHRPLSVEVEKLNVADETTPLPDAEISEAQVLFEEALLQLTKAQREIIRLRFSEGLSFDEISERTGISSPSARKRVSRLVERFRKVKGIRKGPLS